VSGGAQLVRSGGTASDTVISAGSEIVSAGGSTVGMTIGSGATAIIMPGAFGVVQSGGTFADSGTLVNSGTINVADGGTLALYAPVVSNKGTVSLSGTGSGVGATLLLDPGGGAVLLSGGGKIVLSSSGNNLVSAATAVTLTNLDNTAGECAKRHRHARGGMKPPLATPPTKIPGAPPLTTSRPLLTIPPVKADSVTDPPDSPVAMPPTKMPGPLFFRPAEMVPVLTIPPPKVSRVTAPPAEASASRRCGWC
jgi:autotransporter passenger strand-loop-strand repeat protein